MPLINCKVKLKLKWTKYRVLSVGCNGILNNIDSDRIVLTIKDTELYVPVVTLSARDKGFERYVCWNECKTKSENKNTSNEYRYILEPNFFGFNKLFVLVDKNGDENAKKFKAKRYYLPTEIINNYNVIINGKNFYHQPTDSDIK